MIRYVCIGLCLIFHLNGYGQDSLVYFQELDFHSDFEKSTFTEYLENDKSNYFDLFIGIDPQINQAKVAKAYQKFTSTMERLNTSKVLGKKPAKKIKVIYEQVHDDLFDQYQELNLFSEVFSSGKYNCVSATAMYALAFLELNIPFSIKEKPTHVYAVAYPDQDQILVEATDPTGGYIRFTESNKQALIERLANAKLISSQEKRTMSVDALFSKYYLSDEDIDTEQLVGIQYLNDAIYSMQKEEVKRAHSQAEKAWFFYPGNRTKNLLLATCLMYLSEQHYENEESVSYLSQFARFDIIDQDFVISEFNRMVSILLVERGEPDKLELYFKKLIPTITNEELKQEMSYIYYYENGRIAYNQAKYGKALDFFEKGYMLKPKNQDISNVFVTTMIQTSVNASNIEMLEKLEVYKEKYPNLMDNNKFRSILLNSYLIQFGMAFDLKNEKEGLKYKQLFEQNYTPEITIDHGNIGRSYSIVAVYYFRRGYTTKARNILNEGLNISPHNHELLVRKRMIK